MQPTEIKVFPTKSTSSVVKAFMQVTFDNLLTVKFRVMDTGKGLWIAFPSEKNPKDNKFYDQVSIVGARDDGTPGQEFYRKLTGTLIRKYQESIGESGDVSTNKPAPPKQKPSGMLDDGVPF